MARPIQIAGLFSSAPRTRAISGNGHRQLALSAAGGKWRADHAGSARRVYRSAPCKLLRKQSPALDPHHSSRGFETVRDWGATQHPSATVIRPTSICSPIRQVTSADCKKEAPRHCFSRGLGTAPSATCADPAASTQMPSHPSAQASLWMIAPCRPSDYLALFHLLTGVMVPCGVLTSELVVVIVSSSKLIFCVRMAPSNDGFVACSTV